MGNKFSKIEESLNIETSIVPVIEPIDIKPTDSPNDPQKDYEYSRGQLYSLISKGQEAVDGILEIAQESGHPRAFEVAGQLIKSVADTTDKLIDLQKKMKELDAPLKNGPTTVNNSLFVGSTAELSKLIKQGLLNNAEETEVK
jgi:hypothetical protein